MMTMAMASKCMKYMIHDNMIQARNTEAMRASDLETRLRATETQLGQR